MLIFTRIILVRDPLYDLPSLPEYTFGRHVMPYYYWLVTVVRSAEAICLHFFFTKSRCNSFVEHWAVAFSSKELVTLVTFYPLWCIRHKTKPSNEVKRRNWSGCSWATASSVNAGNRHPCFHLQPSGQMSRSFGTSALALVLAATCDMQTVFAMLPSSTLYNKFSNFRKRVNRVEDEMNKSKMKSFGFIEIVSLSHSRAVWRLMTSWLILF